MLSAFYSYHYIGFYVEAQRVLVIVCRMKEKGAVEEMLICRKKVRISAMY